MSQFKNIVLVTIVSPEVLFLSAMLGTLYLNPPWLGSIGLTITSNKEVWKFLPSLTLGLAAVAYTYSSKLRAPLNSSNKILYDWGLYPLLVGRVMVSLAFSTLCGISALSLWIFGDDMQPALIAIVFLSATLISGITALTMMLAHQKLREMLEKYQS